MSFAKDLKRRLHNEIEDALDMSSESIPDLLRLSKSVIDMYYLFLEDKSSLAISLDFHYFEEFDSLSILMFNIQNLDLDNIDFNFVSNPHNVLNSKSIGQVIGLMKQKVRRRRNCLKSLCKLHAIVLGMLVKNATFKLTRTGTNSSLDLSSNTKEHQFLGRIFQAANTLCKCLEKIASLYNSLIEEPCILSSSQRISLIRDIQTDAEKDQPTVENLENLLNAFPQKLKEYKYSVQKFHQQFGKPNIFVRYWIPSTIGLITALYFTGLVLKRKDKLLNIAYSLVDTAQAFYINWIQVPLIGIWDTIHHSDEFKFTSQTSLASDLNSLERMVVDYARDQNLLSPNDLLNLPSHVRDGDLSIVLKQYENDMKHPLKNIVAGDMIRLILIQVQKAKVDLELATSALDKLLRSNELNFAFLAIVPSLVILSSTYAFLRQAYKQRRGIGTRGAVYQIRSRLLTIERILNKCKLEWKNNGLSSPTEEEIEFLTYGEILMELHLIRQYSRQVISKFNTIQDNNSFYQDILDLEDVAFTIEQKMRTVERMFRYYSFLRK